MYPEVLLTDFRAAATGRVVRKTFSFRMSKEESSE